MPNPFENEKPRCNDKSHGHKSYLGFMRSFLAGKYIDEVFEVPLHGRSIQSARSTIRHCSNEMRAKFRTKTNKQGRLYAMRIKYNYKSFRAPE